MGSCCCKGYNERQRRRELQDTLLLLDSHSREITGSLSFHYEPPIYLPPSPMSADEPLSPHQITAQNDSLYTNHLMRESVIDNHLFPIPTDVNESIILRKN